MSGARGREPGGLHLGQKVKLKTGAPEALEGCEDRGRCNWDGPLVSA